MDNRGKRLAAVTLVLLLCAGLMPVAVKAKTEEEVIADASQSGTEEPQPDGEEEPDFEAGPFEAEELQEIGWTEEPAAEPAGDGSAYEEPVYEEPVPEEKKEEILHQPKLVLESHNLDAQGLSAGEQKEFSAVFRNRSQDRSIYNLKLSLSCEDTGVTADQGSFYFEKIGPLGQVDIHTILRAAPQAEQKNVTMEFAMEYEDDKGTACTGAEKLSFFVSQPVQAAISGFHMEDQVFASDRVKQEITVVNTGKAPIYQVKVTVEGKGLFVTDEVLLGSLEAGASGEGALGIYVGTKDMKEMGETTEGADREKYGSTKGALIITYQDALGAEYEQRQVFTTVIQKAKILELKVEKEKKETNQWWISIFVLLLSAAVGGLIILSAQLRKSRKRMKEAMVVREEFYGKQRDGE
ncbi:MAG: hypothetical protein ACOYBE_05800 [Blautia sp.]|jgi:hypothetical protein